MYKDKPIKEYLDALASREPVPGGGSAAALVAATGIALLSKVANFTLGKEKYKDVEAQMKDMLKRADALRETFLELCSEDARAYKNLSRAFKMPKTDERAAKLQDALKEAMSVPLRICQGAHRAIKLCDPLAEKGNRNLLSDVDCGREMLICAYKAALLNVEINLKSIKDAGLVDKTRKTLETMKGDTG